MNSHAGFHRRKAAAQTVWGACRLPSQQCLPPLAAVNRCARQYNSSGHRLLGGCADGASLATQTACMHAFCMHQQHHQGVVSCMHYQQHRWQYRLVAPVILSSAFAHVCCIHIHELSVYRVIDCTCSSTLGQAAAAPAAAGSRPPRLLAGVSAERVQRLEALVELKKLYRNCIRAEALLGLPSPVYVAPDSESTCHQQQSSKL